MKYSMVIFSALVALALLGSCCTTKTTTYTYKLYSPVYRSMDDIRNSISISSPQDLVNPGKIYVFGNYLFICEKGQGIHIYDNSNPSAPSQVSFLVVPGNGDIAVRNSVMYVDSYIDLVALDISNPLKPKEVKRLQGIFPSVLSDGSIYVDPTNGAIISYNIKDTTVTYTYTQCSGESTSPTVDYMGKNSRTSDGSTPNGSSSGSGNQSGVGGSEARFTLYSNYLYIADNTNLQTIDISVPSNPRAWSKTNIGWNIQTIFPYKDKLFIGSQTGMYIYDNSTPWNPTYMSTFSHARSCDPVVANDKYCYITLRSGTNCNWNVNELDILDITNLTNPTLISTYPMQSPAGLGVDGSTLFICDGAAGVKVFDVSNPKAIQLQSWLSDFVPYDIIPLGKTAIIVGPDGLYQYDYTNPKSMILLSKIPIIKKTT